MKGMHSRMHAVTGPISQSVSQSVCLLFCKYCRNREPAFANFLSMRCSFVALHFVGFSLESGGGCTQDYVSIEQRTLPDYFEQSHVPNHICSKLSGGCFTSLICMRTCDMQLTVWRAAAPHIAAGTPPEPRSTLRP